LKVVAHLTIPKRSLRVTPVKAIGEWFFALFPFAGYYKGDPRLAFIQTHLDLTLLFLILSFQVFFHRLLIKPFTQKILAGFIKVAALFLLLASCLLGGLLISQSTGYGLDKTLRFIVLTGWAFFGTAFLITDFQSLRRFSWAVVIIATVMAIDALLHYPGIGKVAFVSALGSNYIALARAGGFGLLTTLTFLLPIERGPLVRLSLLVMAALQFWAALSAGARRPVSALILAFLDFFALSARGFPRLRINRFALQLGFTDYIGFRCGTCRDFPVFNLKTREPLRLRERPRIAMDTTLLVLQYMALRPEQAIEWVERLSSTCRRFGGILSLLWHNNSLIEPWQRELYLEALEMAVR
jgi:hypothetical protein